MHEGLTPKQRRRHPKREDDSATVRKGLTPKQSCPGRFATAPKLPVDLTAWPLLAARLQAAWARPAWAAGLAAAAR